MTDTQNQQILKLLQGGGSLTAIDALNLFGCFRLSGRILELRQSGHPIFDEWVYQNGKKFKRYYLKQ